MLHALIMAGGGGTRFWPRSRLKRPKQFLRLAGERTLLQQAFDRIEGPMAPQNTWVITAAMHAGEVVGQLATVPADHAVGQPLGRGTAACMALGAALMARQDPSATMPDRPADPALPRVRAIRTP